DQEVHRAPLLLDLGVHLVDRGNVLNVARQDHLATDRFRERLDPAAQRLALIGEGERGAVGGQGLGDAPGNRMIVGDPHDQAAFALHQLRHRATELSTSCPASCRASTFLFLPSKTWMAGTSPAMTRCHVDFKSHDSHTSSRLNTTEALVPPKPNEFDSTTPSFTLSCR